MNLNSWVLRLFPLLLHLLNLLRRVVLFLSQNWLNQKTLSHCQCFRRHSQCFLVFDFILFVFLHFDSWNWLEEVASVFISHFVNIKGLDVAFDHEFSFVHLVLHALVECGGDDVIVM